MSDTRENISPAEVEAVAASETIAPAPPKLPRWKKGLVGLALILGLVGLALHGFTSTPDSHTQHTVANSTRTGAASSLASQTPRSLLVSPATPSEEQTPQADSQADLLDQPLKDWSQPLMKFGFSFVVGFCIGYALAVFMKLTVFAVGLLVLALFGLQYGDVIDVNWHSIQAHYDAFLAWLQPRASGFRAFITGHLPSVGMAALGILTGFKRR